MVRAAYIYTRRGVGPLPVLAVTEDIKGLYMRRRLWKGVVAYYKDGAEPAFGTSLCGSLADSNTLAQCIWHMTSGH